MEPVVDNSTAYGLREAGSHPEDHPPRTPELGEGAAGMVLTTGNEKADQAAKFALNLTQISLRTYYQILLSHPGNNNRSKRVNRTE